MSLTTVKQHGQTAVDMFNQSANTHIGASVYYLKSELEARSGRQLVSPLIWCVTRRFVNLKDSAPHCFLKLSQPRRDTQGVEPTLTVLT